MRKIKLQVQVSIDGFNARNDGAMDWMTWVWDDKLKQYVSDLHTPVDCILLGRKMAEGFVPHWEGVVANPEDPSHEFGKLMVETPKVLFSRTLTTSPWNNTTLATGDLKSEIKKLKELPGGDIIVYGGTEFVGNLIKENLIDEYNLFINPTAIGKGTSIFSAIEANLPLELKRSIAFDCGIVALKYERK